MIERHHLHILQRVSSEGSVTAAARALCLTQPALSHSIRKLEQELGVSLWTVSGRTIQLTQAGQHLLRLAERVVPEFECAERQMRSFSAGKKGILTIGMECHPCYRWLLTIVRPYLAAWPDVELDIKQEFQFGGMAALFRREIDLLVTPDPLYKKSLFFHRVFDYELVLVVAKTHRFAQNTVIHAEDLQHETLLTYPVEPSRLDIFTQFLMPASSLPMRHQTIQSTDIMLEMVAAQRGVTAMPSWFMAEYQKKMPLHSLRLGKNGVFKSLFLGVRRGELPAYLSAFIALCKSLQTM